MNRTTQRGICILTLVAGLGLPGAWTLSSTPQSGRRREASRYYDAGLRDGRQDAERRRDHRYHAHPDRDADRRAYQDGYDTGYREVMARRGGRDDRDSRDRDRNPRGFGAGSSGTLGGLAAQNGHNDGLNDGRKDRATGHSFRPTEGDNYKPPTGAIIHNSAAGISTGRTTGRPTRAPTSKATAASRT